MENTTEIKVTIFNDGKEPVTCYRGYEKDQRCKYMLSHEDFNLVETFDFEYSCFIFDVELKSDDNGETIPCPECLQARKEAKDAKL